MFVLKVNEKKKKNRRSKIVVIFLLFKFHIFERYSLRSALESLTMFLLSKRPSDFLEIWRLFATERRAHETYLISLFVFFAPKKQMNLFAFFREY